MAAFDRLATVDLGRAAMPTVAAPVSPKVAPVARPSLPPPPPVQAPMAPAPVAPVPAAAPAVQAAVPTQRGPILFKRVPPTLPLLAGASGKAPPGGENPAEPATGDESGPGRSRRVAALMAAAVLGALFLGFAITQAIGLLGGIGSGPTPTPGQSGLQTTQPSPSIRQPSGSPTATPVPTAVPTPTGTPIPTPKPTPPPPPGAPSSPRNLTAVVSIGQIALSWSAPTSGGGSNVFRYDLYRDASNIPIWTGNAFSHTDVVGNGQTHIYRVTAVNAVGSSAYSIPAGGTTPNVPGAPGNPQAAVVGVGQITVSWLAPASNGRAISGYQIYRNGALIYTNPAGALTYSDTALAPGTLYTYAIRAVNAVGVGPNSFNATATTWTSPGAPTGVLASAGNGQILVSWTAPAFNGNTPIMGYSVYDNFSSLRCTTTGALSCTDTALPPNASRTYTVTATNAFGPSLSSAPSNTAITWTSPGAPTGVLASAGNGQILVSWTAPAFNGNTPITGYSVYDNSSSLRCTTTGALSCTDTGLLPNTPRSYTVTATNAFGPSLSSAPSSTATTWTSPGAPTAVLASGGNGQILVSWTAPAFNGNTPITGYSVYDNLSNLRCTTSGAVSCADTGLGQNVSHSYTVTATNAFGTSVPSAASNTATTWSSPGAPTLDSATLNGTNVVLSWSPPAVDGGSSVTGYSIYRDGNQIALVGNVTTWTDASPPPGTYTYTVAAINVVGTGSQSNGLVAIVP